jgi:hypothetical protein
MRTAYTRIQTGMETSYKITQDRIELLEGMGFRWTAIGLQMDSHRVTTMGYLRRATKSSRHLKRSLDITMFLKSIKINYHWGGGVAL